MFAKQFSRKITAICLMLILIISLTPSVFAGSSTKYPELTESGQNFTIAVNNNRGYTVKNDGTLWEWDNADPSTVGGVVPVKIMDNAVSVRVNSGNTFVLTSDGAVWAWESWNKTKEGGNTNPERILEDVTAIAAEYDRNGVFAIKNNGTLIYLTNNSVITVMDNVESVFVTHEATLLDDRLPDKLSLEDGVFVVKTDGSLWKTAVDFYGNVKQPERITTQVSEHLAEMKDSPIDADGNMYSHYTVMEQNAYGEWEPLWKSDLLYENIAAHSTDSFGNSLYLKKDGTLLASSVFYNQGESFEILTDVRLPIAGIKEAPSSWAAEQVNAAIAARLVPVSLQSRYTQPITRAEFCALAVALYEEVAGEIGGRGSFTDTSDANVGKAAFIGVVSGVGDNKFAPDNTLTREQAATMLSHLAEAIGMPLTKQAANFADNGDISAWALDGVGQVQASGIMSGIGNNLFAPKSPYTREQSMITIMRLFDILK